MKQTKFKTDVSLFDCDGTQVANNTFIYCGKVTKVHHYPLGELFTAGVLTLDLDGRDIRFFGQIDVGLYDHIAVIAQWTKLERFGQQLEILDFDYIR